MRVRFTIRWLMLAVALVAFAGAGVRWVAVMRHRSRMYQFDADLHDIKSKYAAIRAKSWYRDEAEKAAARKAATEHAKRRDLYKEASAHPWRDVAPADGPRID